jgi:hypothetical protein
MLPTSLAIPFAYCRHKHIVTKLIAKDISHMLESEINFPSISLNIHNTEKCLIMTFMSF